MTFAIDAGDVSVAPVPKSSGIDEGQSIDLRDGLRAERMHRQIIQAIESCETAEMLAEYMAGESVLLDAFYLNRPEFWALIDDAQEMQRAILTRANPSAKAETDPAAPGNCLGITF
ncbi:MAG: hypothetical protein ACPGFA_01240 [Pikeienuella sp.]